MIKLYLGAHTPATYTDESHYLEVQKCNFIDVLDDEYGKRPLYIVVKISNKHHYDILYDEQNKVDRNDWMGKHIHFCFKGYKMFCLSSINKSDKSRFDYRHKN